jgi:5'-3' exonuclease
VIETSKLAQKLTEEEIKRNTFGQTLHYHCAVDTHYPEITVYHLPALPLNSNPFRLLPQALTGIKTPFNLPCLRSILIDSAIPLHIHVDVFGSRSQKASLLLGLVDLYDARKRDIISNQFLGKICSMWPYKREVLVVGFSDMEYEYSTDKPPKKFSPKEIEQWVYRAEIQQKKWKDTRAINCVISCLFTVRFSRKLPDVSERDWNSKVDYIPFQFLNHLL